VLSYHTPFPFSSEIFAQSKHIFCRILWNIALRVCGNDITPSAKANSLRRIAEAVIVVQNRLIVRTAQQQNAANGVNEQERTDLQANAHRFAALHLAANRNSNRQAPSKGQKE
jgi:hypothetical protein